VKTQDRASTPNRRTGSIRSAESGAPYLRRSGRPTRERAFNEDLAYFKNNGWSLWGLGEAPAQGKDAQRRAKR
jgi:hypothetical protein